MFPSEAETRCDKEISKEEQWKGKRGRETSRRSVAGNKETIEERRREREKEKEKEEILSRPEREFGVMNEKEAGGAEGGGNHLSRGRWMRKKGAAN